MGTFVGHTALGSLFFFSGLLIFVNGILCIRRRNKPFISTLIFPNLFFCWRFKEWPMLSVIRLVAIGFAIFMEIYNGFLNGKFVYMEDVHHVTMEIAFAMVDVVIILQHYTKRVPANAEYVMLSFAFMIEGILFANHLHGRTAVDVTVHTLAAYVMFACAFVTLAIAQCRHNVLLFLTHAYVYMLQGTWLIQIGFILFNPTAGAKPWDPEEHDTMMWLPLLFAWHCIGVLLVMPMVAGVIIYCKERKYPERENKIHDVTSGYIKVKMNDVMSDSDGESETEQL